MRHERYRRVKRLWEAGWSLAQIAKQEHVPEHVLRAMLERERDEDRI